MKSLTLILTTLFLFSSPLVWGEEVDFYDDLVIRDGLYYKKFSDEPFTGTVCCDRRGKINKGIPVGKWTDYYTSGQLRWRNNYKNGEWNGLTENYYKNGRLSSRGYHKNDKMVDKWEFYNEDGTLDEVIDYGE